MSERGLNRADRFMALFLLALGLAVVWGAWTMDRLEIRQIHPASVPGLVPGLLGIALVLCGGLLLARALRPGGIRAAEGPEAAGWLTAPEAARLGTTVLLTLAYPLVLIGRMPFELATGLFVFAFIALFEWDRSDTRRRRAVKLATALLQAILVAAIVSVVFEQLFLVRLP